MSPTAIKTVEIQRDPAAVFAFLADGANWPRYAIHNILAISPASEGDWLIETPRGQGRLRLHPDATQGILDHEFIDPREGIWEVAARVVPVGDHALFVMCLPKPPGATGRGRGSGRDRASGRSALRGRCSGRSALPGTCSGRSATPGRCSAEPRSLPAGSGDHVACP